MSHAETRIVCTLPSAIAKLETDEGSAFLVPHVAEAMEAMNRVRRNYAKLHGLWFWEVGVKTTGLSPTSILFEAYRMGNTPRGDSS
jgi:hypothetical protein